MVIKASDRLSDVLARDDRILETILATVPDLRGLRNPVTRRVMGRLTTVAQLARMAGIEPDILLRRVNKALASPDEVASPNEVEDASARDAAVSPSGPHQEIEVSDTINAIPAFLTRLDPAHTSDLDVREDLRNGREPFSRIMAAKAALPAGAVLRLRATFEPVPLYAVMGKQGFEHWTERLADDDWRVWFYPAGLANDEAAPAETPAGVSGAVEASGAVAAESPEGGGRTAEDPSIVILDVRGLEPPEPMVRTLAALESLEAGKTLLQINERVPQFLIPRLEELGFTHEIREQAEGVVRVFIHRPVQD